MTVTELVTCPSCGAKNRFPARADISGARCGRCRVAFDAAPDARAAAQAVGAESAGRSSAGPFAPHVSLLRFLVSSTGRMGPLAWLVGMAGLYCLVVTLGLLAGMSASFALLAVAGLPIAMLGGVPMTIRRFHDLGHSGWWTLMVFVVPPLSSVIAVVWLASARGTVGPNRFGPAPPAAPVREGESGAKDAGPASQRNVLALHVVFMILAGATAWAAADQYENGDPRAAFVLAVTAVPLALVVAYPVLWWTWPRASRPLPVYGALCGVVAVALLIDGPDLPRQVGDEVAGIVAVQGPGAFFASSRTVLTSEEAVAVADRLRSSNDVLNWLEK